MGTNKTVALVIAGILVLTGLLVIVALKTEQVEKEKEVKRGGADVVATYVGGEITRSELRRYINRNIHRSPKHQVCEKHGWDHSACELDEACESHPLGTLDSYRILLRSQVMDKMVERWIKEKGLAAREETGHRLKHIVEEVNLAAMAGEMHKDKIEPDRIEIRGYYEEHRDEYRGRSFRDVEDEIRTILAAQKQEEFVIEYIEELKANAVISRNYDLLKIGKPKESEIRDYYERHRKEYVVPERIRFREIRIPGSDDKAREKAETALARLRAGEDFDEVAAELSEGGARQAKTVEKGQESAAFEKSVGRLYAGEVSPVIEDGGILRVVKVLERKDKRRKTLEEVLGDVRAAVIREKEEEVFKQNKYEALFSIHGKRFTVKEFEVEFDELTPGERRRYASFEAKKNLLDRMIVKELLVEEAEDKVVTAERQREIEKLKLDALREMLHREEVDEKIAISDEELSEAYEKHKFQLQEPAKAWISMIGASMGFSEDERKRAREKIEEAEAKLRGGADFAAVAKEYSDHWTASQGGVLDRPIYEGASHLGEIMEHGFHRYVFALQPGETSDFFEFQNHFFIVKTREKEESRQQTLEEAKPRLRQWLTSRKHHERTLELQNELLEESKLVVYDHVLSRMLREEHEAHAHERE